jgi:hypothetical protein
MRSQFGEPCQCEEVGAKDEEYVEGEAADVTDVSHEDHLYLPGAQPAIYECCWL